MGTRLYIALALGLAACRAPKNASYGPGYTSRYHHDPTRVYQTFSINPVSDTGTSLTAFNRKWIVSETRAQMVKKGLTPGDATADLLVNIVSVDSSRAGQMAGRPLNDWYRLFHGGTIRPAGEGPGEIVGTLLPDSLLQQLDSGWVVHPKRAARTADSQRHPLDTAPPGAGGPPVAGGPSPSKEPQLAYGALVIDVIDRDKRLLLWEGIANRAVDIPARDAEKRTQAMVIRLMEGYQPGTGPKDTAKGVK